MDRVSKIQKSAKFKCCTAFTLSCIHFSLMLLLVTTSGCGSLDTIEVDADEEIKIEQAQLQKSNLLDVGVIVLKSGAISPKQKENDSISLEIRQAEARYISYHLRETIQKTSGWRSVNVLPSESEIVDVIVDGEIIESIGEKLKLKIAVADSAGTSWFENTYQTKVTRKDYTKLKGENDLAEIYQGMYNRIANDINAYRKKIDGQRLASIRNTSELK